MTISATPPSTEQTDLIYHYTSTQALLNIIQKNKIVLWATHYQYLNDMGEIKKGIEIMNQHFLIDESQFDNLFILALSRTVDDLTMWQSYSEGYNGCILGFKYVQMEGDMIQCFYGEKEVLNYYSNFTELVEKGVMTYPQTTSQIKDKPFIDVIIRKLKQDIEVTSVIGYKNASFKYENESRFYTILKNEELSQVKFRSRNGLIIPYIERRFNKNILSEIWIPNNQNTNMNINSLKRLLSQNECENVEIKVSNIPFRRM